MGPRVDGVGKIAVLRAAALGVSTSRCLHSTRCAPRTRTPKSFCSANPGLRSSCANDPLRSIASSRSR